MKASLSMVYTWKSLAQWHGLACGDLHSCLAICKAMLSHAAMSELPDSPHTTRLAFARGWHADERPCLLLQESFVQPMGLPFDWWLPPSAPAHVSGHFRPLAQLKRMKSWLPSVAGTFTAQEPAVP